MTHPIHPLAGTAEEVLAFEAAAAPAAVAVPDERAAFEAWFLQKGSAHQLERNEAKGWYENAWANAGWEAWQARAALAAAPAAAPAGWKLVPVQPTTEMCKAANDLSTNRNRWAAMLAAAPAAVQTHAEAAAALGINSALSRIRIGNAAGAIEPLKHALRVLTAPVPVARPEPAAAIREVMALVSDWCIKEHLSGQAQFDAHGSEATPVDEDRAKRCWIEEREAWQAIEDKLRALLAGVSAPAVQAVEQAPVLYVSKEQLDSHRDPGGSGSFGAGRYLPARITPAGNFTTPLFVAPQAPAADALDAARYRGMRDKLYGENISIGEATLIFKVTGNCPDISEFDAGIDAAIAAQAAAKEGAQQG